MAWKKIFALMAAFLLFCCACGEKTPVSDPALQKQQQALRIFCPEEEYTDLSDALAAFRSKILSLQWILCGLIRCRKWRISWWRSSIPAAGRIL